LDILLVTRTHSNVMPCWKTDLFDSCYRRDAHVTGAAGWEKLFFFKSQQLA